jgi:hypothetical protein
MVRRGSTVRVRQRACQERKSRKSGFLLPGSAPQSTSQRLPDHPVGSPLGPQTACKSSYLSASMEHLHRREGPGPRGLTARDRKWLEQAQCRRHVSRPGDRAHGWGQVFGDRYPPGAAPAEPQGRWGWVDQARLAPAEGSPRRQQQAARPGVNLSSTETTTRWCRSGSRACLIDYATVNGLEA